MECGHMVGHRIYHTSDLIYGAGAAGTHQDIVSMDEAKSVLVRMKVESEGVPSSFSTLVLGLPTTSR